MRPVDRVGPYRRRNWDGGGPGKWGNDDVRVVRNSSGKLSGKERKEKRKRARERRTNLE